MPWGLAACGIMGQPYKDGYLLIASRGNHKWRSSCSGQVGWHCTWKVLADLSRRHHNSRKGPAVFEAVLG